MLSVDHCMSVPHKACHNTCLSYCHTIVHRVRPRYWLANIFGWYRYRYILVSPISVLVSVWLMGYWLFGISQISAKIHGYWPKYWLNYPLSVKWKYRYHYHWPICGYKYIGVVTLDIILVSARPIHGSNPNCIIHGSNPNAMQGLKLFKLKVCFHYWNNF